MSNLRSHHKLAYLLKELKIKGSRYKDDNTLGFDCKYNLTV